MGLIILFLYFNYISLFHFPSPVFLSLWSFPISCYCMHVCYCILVCSHIPKYYLLSPSNVTCTYVFRVDHLVRETNWCTFPEGGNLSLLALLRGL